MLELRVCIGSACHLKGAYNVIQTFQQMIEENALHDKISFKSAFCMKYCHGEGVAVSINGEPHSVKALEAREFFRSAIMASFLS